MTHPLVFFHTSHVVFPEWGNTTGMSVSACEYIHKITAQREGRCTVISCKH